MMPSFVAAGDCCDRPSDRRSVKRQSIEEWSTVSGGSTSCSRIIAPCLPNADINRRDCDVRSLAGPEPDRQVFPKFEHLFTRAAPLSETICITIGKILRAFTPTECATGHALVFVRLAHDRRFVGAVLFLFVFAFVVFVFIRISGRHRVAHDHEGTPVDQSGRFLRDVWDHVVAPRVWTLVDFDIIALNDFVQPCWMKSRITAMARSASGIAGNLQSVRAERGAEGLLVIPLARIPDRFS
jgi:hypothetical protein